MPDVDSRFAATIPENLVLARLAQSEQMREFFIQMWLQNPSLAKHAERRVRDLLAPLGSCDRIRADGEP